MKGINETDFDKAVGEKGWVNEGWYTIRFWDSEAQDWASPEVPEPYWIENAWDFDAATSHYYSFYEPIVEYLGDGEDPIEQ